MEYFSFNISFHFVPPMGRGSYPNFRLGAFSLQSSKAHSESISAALVLCSYGTNVQGLWQWFIVQERHTFQKQRWRKKDIICLVFAIFTLLVFRNCDLKSFGYGDPLILNSPNRSSIWVKDSFFSNLKENESLCSHTFPIVCAKSYQ